MNHPDWSFEYLTSEILLRLRFLLRVMLYALGGSADRTESSVPE